MKTQQKTPEPLPARDGYVIPSDVAVCPECGGKLYLTDDYDRTSPEPLPLDCEDEDWEDDDGVHRGWQSEWQPVIDKVRRHLNSHNVAGEATASKKGTKS
jgi:hypothetical protein